MQLGALDRGDDVGGGPRYRGLRQHDGPGRPQRLRHGCHGLECLGFSASREVIAGDGDAQPVDTLDQARQGRIGGTIGADRIVGIPPLHRIER